MQNLSTLSFAYLQAVAQIINAVTLAKGEVYLWIPAFAEMTFFQKA
jgi:hypothetical protein